MARAAPCRAGPRFVRAHTHIYQGMATSTLRASVAPDGSSLDVAGAAAGAAVSVLDAASGETLAEAAAGEGGALTLTAEALAGRPTLAGRLLLVSSGGMTALAFDRRPLLDDLRSAACELTGGCGRPLWFIEKFLLLRGLEAAALLGDAPRAARLWGLTGWDGAPGRPAPGRRGGCGCHAR